MKLITGLSARRLAYIPDSNDGAGGIDFYILIEFVVAQHFPLFNLNLDALIRFPCLPNYHDFCWSFKLH